MSGARKLNRLLPQKFAGILPLFIGVEIILGLAILNKASGLYGILSIFTGHPINFWQWLYNAFAIVLLPFYILGLTRINSGDAGVFSLVCLVYVADSVIGVLFTLYFVYYWFHNEAQAPAVVEAVSSVVGDPLDDNYPVKQAVNLIKREVKNNAAVIASAAAEAAILASQSATPAYELFFILGSSIFVTALRVYFTFVVISFTKGLLKQEINNGSTPKEYPDNKIYKVLLQLEERSKQILRDFFK